MQFIFQHNKKKKKRPDEKEDQENQSSARPGKAGLSCSVCVDTEPFARITFLDAFPHIIAHPGGEMEGDNLIIFETSHIIDG